MEWLNFHHLHYFWTVAREGSVTRAAERLCVTPATVSVQLRQFEQAIGEPLLLRQGRGLQLTATGQVVFRHAEEIFAIGDDLREALRHRSTDRPTRLHVGIAKALPKLVAYTLLRPALSRHDPLQIVCHEDRPEQLLARLALHELDVVLADTPGTPNARVKAYYHLLGECKVGWYGTPDLVASHLATFPASLNDAPLLLPTTGTSLRRSIDEQFARQGVRPRIVGEFDDPALIKTFAYSGAGLFAAPVVMAEELQRRYGFACVGVETAITERFYAISVERKLRHPAVLTLLQAARDQTFAPV